jgi:16S rRNA (guanine527-N7)-methyltransferase
MRDGRADSSAEAPVRERIETGLTEIFGSFESHHADQLTRLVSLLSEWAPRMNLTGHRDPMDIASRLVLDAAALVHCLPELDRATDLADLGSGAGFPGLPIAILRPQLGVSLIESRQKRHHFQREARRQLGLERVTPLLGRSDEIETRPSDVVVAQAMTQPEQALTSMRRWARAGGILVLPAAEMAERPRLPDTDTPLERRSYRVPFTGVSRQLWVARVSPS